MNLNRLVILFNPLNARGIGDSTLPIGLLMVAINLQDKYKVVIVDQRVEKNWKSRLLCLLKENPVCLGITAMTGRQIREGLRASRLAKKEGCPVVWGGIHSSLLPQQTISHPLVDYVVEGEGEESFAELVEVLAAGRSAKNILGVWTKENNDITFGGQRAFIDLNKLPPTPYHLVDLKKYIKSGPYGKSILLFTSRGCPQQCKFCFNHSFNKSRWRSFSSERVLEDIKYILNYRPDIIHFQFWDDNFFPNLLRAKEIAQGIKKINSAITWSALGAHIRDISRMNDEYLADLRGSGLKEVLVGVESGSQRIIDLVKKNFVIEELFCSNRRLGKYNIRPTYSFISGIPGESDEDIKKTIETMFQLKKENPNIVLGNIKPFVCYPGAALSETATELGFIPPKHLEGWSRFAWTDYLNMDVPWVSPKRRRFLTWLYYYTLLMSPTYMFIDSKIFTFVVSILRPIAQWRVQRFNFSFPVEAWLIHTIYKYVL